MQQASGFDAAGIVGSQRQPRPPSRSHANVTTSRAKSPTCNARSKEITTWFGIIGRIATSWRARTRNVSKQFPSLEMRPRSFARRSTSTLVFCPWFARMSSRSNSKLQASSKRLNGGHGKKSKHETRAGAGKLEDRARALNASEDAEKARGRGRGRWDAWNSWTRRGAREVAATCTTLGAS